MDELQQTTPVDVHWRSFELRPAGTTIPEWYRERVMASRPRFNQMMQEQYGITIDAGPWGINSRRALIGAKVAEAQGEDIGAAYHRGVLSAYWLEGRDIGDDAVLQDIAASAGIDPAAFLTALDEPQYDNAVSLDVDLARQIGITGVPALIFDKKFYVAGWQPAVVLRQVVDEVERDQPPVP